MRKALCIAVAMAASVAATGVVAAGTPGAPAKTAAAAPRPAERCDETCLKGYMDKFLAALAARDPSRAPFAANLRYTENGVQIRPGEALWFGFNGLGKYRHDFYDTQSGQVGVFVDMTENHDPGMLHVRLRIAGGKIVEAETVVSRGNRNAAKMDAIDPAWLAFWDREEPTATRLTRKQLEEGVLNHLRAVAFHDSHIARFTDDCIRLENGNVSVISPNDTHPPVPMGRGGGDGGGTAAGRGGRGGAPPAAGPPAAARPDFTRMGCDGQIDSLSTSFIQGFESAHFPLIDVKRQIVFGAFDFVRRGNVRAYIYRGVTYPIGANAAAPSEGLNSEAWKFTGGRIAKVEAVFPAAQAYGLGTGWPGTKRILRPIDDTAGGRLILGQTLPAGGN